MTCHEVSEQIPAWLDGELAGDRAAAIATHVGGCVACREAVDHCLALHAAARGAGDNTADRIGIAVAGQAAVATASADASDVRAAVWRRIAEEQGAPSDEIRRMREELVALRAELAEMRLALLAFVAAADSESARPSRSTALDLPYFRRGASGPYRLV